jgi:hypothetical protein
MTIFMPVPCCFHVYGSVVYFEVGCYDITIIAEIVLYYLILKSYVCHTSPTLFFYPFRGKPLINLLYMSFFSLVFSHIFIPTYCLLFHFNCMKSSILSVFFCDVMFTQFLCSWGSIMHWGDCLWLYLFLYSFFYCCVVFFVKVSQLIYCTTCQYAFGFFQRYLCSREHSFICLVVHVCKNFVMCTHLLGYKIWTPKCIKTSKLFFTYSFAC